MTRSLLRRAGPGLWLFGPALAWLAVAVLGLIWTAREPGAWAPIDRRAGGLAGSSSCVACHPAQATSWRRSYHRTMTQPASGAAVLAPFAGESLLYQGFRATMTRSNFGLPHLRVESVEGGAPLLDLDVALTVGSHRYQQYVARVDRGGGPGELWRLPVAWHLGERRWIPMNAAFLEPEGEPGDADDYLRHFSRWNDNCILCHNTEPVPGLSDRSHGTGPEGQAWFASRVGEFGIACEACHGPAGAHVARQADPARRLLGGAGDPAIADPGRMTPRAESGACGRCHGNRIAADVAAVLRAGDGFLPGEDLAARSRPIFADSRVGGSDETPFATRFWPDGTPRLSAYEYQGLLQSPCYQDGQAGGLGCNHCHDMHGERPDMQVRAGRAGQAACAGCHALDPGHGGHGAAIDCQGCHMPRITYGLLEGMISHRISSPDPGAWVGRHDQPDACTQCHVDRSRRWAAEQLPQLGLAGTAAGEEASEEAWAPRVLLDLHGGDPVQRGLAAHALARPEVPVPATTRLAWLVDALEDGYPAVRWMAWRAMQRLAAGQGMDPKLSELIIAYDPHAEAATRLPAVDALRARLGPGPLAEERRLALEARQDASLLSIGE
ncbi:hypothetical protein [Nannocystis sp.]|uniref:hypothetical protein n=1 Tax=Nannocystis sp. TaxID=1962667 RepID=UPI0025E30E93|nr:hypothetical protein [Nannocystis sp.]MBK7824211.1 hypothetical protein [Nannocystis sp.]